MEGYIRKFLLCTAIGGLLCFSLAAAKNDLQSTTGKKSTASASSPCGFSHKVGALWTQVTNYGFYGDRAYVEPNFEWPGGSGNLYGWLTSIWLGAIYTDGIGYVSYGEGDHFRPLDTINVKHPSDGSLSTEDTYTRYTDIDPSSPSGIHMNLGFEVTERTYAWDQSSNDDFIICDYWIKNVNADTLKGVYVGFRMDADVSGFLGTNTTSDLWDRDDLSGYDSTNKVIYIYDGDSPTQAGNDIGNPDPIAGVLRSPGYIGVRLLSYDSSHFQGTFNGQPTMAIPLYRGGVEPLTAQAMYDFMKNSGIAPNATIVRDYRVIMGIGPFILSPYDSMHMAIAWVIGSGLQGILKNSQTAQSLCDHGYTTGVEETPDVLHTEFSLSQNYPNPFNPVTVIRYKTGRAGHVTLKVYDLLGRVIATVVDGYQPAGTHQISFNGSHLASGVYFYTLKSGDFTSTKSFVLAK